MNAANLTEQDAGSRRGPAKQTIVGVNVSATSYDEVLGYCREWIEARPAVPPPAKYICVTSVHGVMTAHEDAGLQKIFNQADIATPDGMPLVWALRSFGYRAQQRVYGPTLMLRLCEQAAARGHRVFLYGGREETLPVLRARLLERFPRLCIAGEYSPPFRSLTVEEDERVTGMIRASQADLVFVGISTPKQEKWMFAHRSSLPGSVMLGVGAAFDFHAGRVRQAPEWVQRAGLEWLFRLTMEPARLWRRYLLTTPRFLPLWALQKAGVLRFAQPSGISTSAQN